MMRFHVTKIDRFFKPFTPLVCWEIFRYLGSTLVLQLGDHVCLRDGGNTFYEGECKISARDVCWNITQAGRILTDSTAVNAKILEDQVKPLFDGAALLEIRVSTDTKFLLMIFDREITLSVDLTNKYATISDIVEAILPDGQIIIIDPVASMSILEEVSTTRKAQNQMKRASVYGRSFRRLKP